jgi:hypothetical protein
VIEPFLALASSGHHNGNIPAKRSTMKKNITLLLFFAIGTVVLMASYRSKENSGTAVDLLTHHSWKFEKAESSNERSASVVNVV